MADALIEQQSASDNYSGICPEAFAAMAQADASCAQACGADPWTKAAADAFRNLFETQCDAPRMAWRSARRS